jgi:6-phosphogluconate dehydrogenase
MELAMIGLGKMGANMAERLVKGGHRVIGVDRDPAAVAKAAESGTQGAESLAAAIGRLSRPRIAWVMVPSGAPVDATLDALTAVMDPDDIVIDGGNSNYQDTMRRARALEAKKLKMLDVGTSGGIWGLAEGYSMMIGGPSETVERLRPIFETLAPAASRGWGRVGPSGAGHYVKMVHNGIEYGLMQAYAEGFAILKHKEEFGLDLPRIAEIWRYGSVVRSWLLDLVAGALAENPGLDGIAPYVVDSGEGRWTVADAIALDVPAPVITLSLIERLRSRDTDSFSDKLLAALRHQFGGHAITKEPSPAKAQG